MNATIDATWTDWKAATAAYDSAAMNRLGRTLDRMLRAELPDECIMTVSAHKPDRPAEISGFTFVRFTYISPEEAARARTLGKSVFECTPGWASVYTQAK